MKSTNIIITIVVLILIAGGSYFIMNSEPEKAMMQKDEMMMKDDKMMMEKEDAMTMVKGASYEAYAPEKISNADSGDVVLFFKASWCPSCRTVDADIKANINNIPETLTILELDYDKATDLKKKYEVTTQHTFVQVDSKGNLIKKWTGGSTLASVVGQVK